MRKALQWCCGIEAKNSLGQGFAVQLPLEDLKKRYRFIFWL